LIWAGLGRLLSASVPFVIATHLSLVKEPGGTILETVLDLPGATAAKASLSIENQGTNGARIAKTGADRG